MELFMLMAVAITVSATLMIGKKREPLHLSFAALCLTIAFHEGGVFSGAIFHSRIPLIVELIGLLAIPPLTISFSRDFCKGQTLLQRRDIRTTALVSIMFAILFFTPAVEWKDTQLFAYIYADVVLLTCYFSLIHYARKKASGNEKKRLFYLILAGTAAIASASIPPLFFIIVSGMLYFILIMITHPHLTELHDLTTRALVIMIVSLFTTIFFYLVIGFFGKGPNLSFTLVFMVSFLIVISIGPFQVILKRMLTSVYPDIKDVFTSPFDLDEKLEREKSLLLEQMAPVLAHEIRNPLGSIKGAAQYLLTEVEPEEQRKLLEVITEEANRLNRVVSQFLDYARPYQLDLQPGSINAVIEKTMTLLEADKISELIHIQMELHPHLPLVPMDNAQIHQVIMNIALNAIESMPEGGTLTVKTMRISGGAGDAVGVSIRDTGQGMPRDVIRQIFTPFFTTKERGTGLGLAVCRRIILNHGGKIRVKSIVGKGTIFYIRLETVH
ncbi:MAG: sensor histidine kinase [Syntrophales bacterium]